MGRQRNMAQMKEQIKTPEELNKMEISNLLDAEFKTLVIRMFKELSENFNSRKKNQSEMEDTLTERKNLWGISSRRDEARNQTSNLEYKEAKDIQSDQQEIRESKEKKKDNVRSLWDNFKCINICIMVGSGRRRESKKLKMYLRK